MHKIDIKHIKHIVIFLSSPRKKYWNAMKWVDISPYWWWQTYTNV